MDDKEEPKPKVETPDLDYVKKTVWDTLGKQMPDKCFFAGVVLFYSMYINANDEKTLSEVSKVPVAFIQRMKARALQRGVWYEDGTVDCQLWFDVVAGGSAFICDCIDLSEVYTAHEAPRLPMETLH